MGWILTGQITSQLRQSRTSVYVPGYRNVRAIIVGRCSADHSPMKSDDGSFTSSISVCCRCSTQSISLDNRKGDLPRSFRYHPLMLSTAIDVRPRDKGRKGTHQESTSYSARSGQIPEAEAQVLDSSGRHLDRYPGFQWSRLLRYSESSDLKKELDGGNEQAIRYYRHEACCRDSLD
jgi:hypothetical protein